MVMRIDNRDVFQGDSCPLLETFKRIFNMFLTRLIQPYKDALGISEDLGLTSNLLRFLRMIRRLVDACDI